MKKILSLVMAFFACFMFSIVAYAEEFTEADKRIFGIFPIWLFILLMAAAVMLAIIIILEIFKRKHK